LTELRIELFGAFRVVVDGCAVPDPVWHRRKPAALVKLLAMAPSHQLHREQVIDALWPDRDPRSAGANLRKALHQARRALGGAAEEPMIASDAELVWLPRGGLWLDVQEFRTAVAQARRAGDVAHYRRALALYREGLLPEDRYEAWAEGPRAELHAEFVAVLDELTRLLEARGELNVATEVVRRLITAEPLLEEGHTTLIRLHALAGRRGQALRAYDQLQSLLASELGTEPSPETQRLVEEIRARQALEPEMTADLWERVGDLRIVSGDAAGAAKAFGRALDAGGSSAVAARLERKCAEAWLGQHRPDEAATHLAWAEAEASDPAERGRVLRARAHLAWETGDLASAQVYAQGARDMALAHGRDDDLAAAHEALAIVAHIKGEWREGLAAELRRVATQRGGVAELSRVLDIHHCIGQYHLYGDGLAESVESYARRLLDESEDAGAVRAQAFAWCLLGESLLLRARYDESHGCLARSCELHASLGSRSGALAWQRRAELAVCCGAHDEVEDHLGHASSIATVSVMARHLWGRIYATRAFAAIEQGDPERAVRAVRAAAAAAARYGDCPTCSALLNPIAAEAFAMLADPGGSRSYAESAGRVADQFTSSAWRAMAASAAASLAFAEGDVETAQLRHGTARELYARAGQPYWAQRSTPLLSLAPT
jgi:DNA-binding SARP family transcriptional activator